jgi:hypothetical protein
MKTAVLSPGVKVWLKLRVVSTFRFKSLLSYFIGIARLGLL